MEKPYDYNAKDDIDKKIQILKNNGNNYSLESLDELMQIINSKNLYKINTENNVNSINILKDTVNYINELLQNDDSLDNLFNKQIIDSFANILNNYTTILQNNLDDNINNESIIQFKNLLMNDIKLNKIKLNEYIIKNANINKKQIINFKNCIDNIFNFDSKNYQNIQEYIKNSFRNIMHVFPNMIINNLKVENSNFIPNYWKLSSKHYDDLINIANNYYKELFKYFNSKKINLILKFFQDKSILIEKLIQNTKFYEPIKYDSSKTTIFTIFDEKLTSLLFENYFYKVLTYFIDLFDNNDFLLEFNNIDIQKEYENTIDDNENDFDIDGGVSKEELDNKEKGIINYNEYIENQKKDLENNSANLIYSFVIMLCENKTFIELEYNTINKKIKYAKDKEKNTIVNFLKELSAEDREIQNTLKNNKLERWSVGLQKGLTIYDPAFYDKERENMEEQLIKERKLQKIDEVSNLNMEIYNLDYQEQLDKEIDEEYSK